KNDLRRLLGDVDKFYQKQEPKTFGLILKADVFTAGVYILALMFMCWRLWMDKSSTCLSMSLILSVKILWSVLAGVTTAPSFAADVSVSAVSTTTADVSAAPTTTTSIAGGPSPSVAEDLTTSTQVPPVTPDLAVVFAHADIKVHADESRLDDNKTASEQVFAKHTFDVSTTVAFTSGVSHATPSSLRKRHKHIAKKRVTPIVDVADDALIKFDSASESDGDPSPYAPYAGWEILPTPFGSIHA
nr:hypothetical protein [Tanacetum cinerariifolium]